MSILDQINKEIIKTMKDKSGDSSVVIRKNILKLMKAELQNNLIVKEEGSGEETLSEQDVLFNYHNKLAKGLTVFTEEALALLHTELKTIKEFLPKELFPEMMTVEEITAIVEKHLPLGNMGAVIKATRAELENRAFDGKVLTEIAKGKLGLL